MDMRRPIYEWVMGSLFDFTSRVDDYDKLPEAGRQKSQARLALRRIRRTAACMAEQAPNTRFHGKSAIQLELYDTPHNVYFYEARATADIVERARSAGGTSVTFDARHRRLIETTRSDGRASRQHDRELALRAAHGARFRHALSHTRLRARVRHRDVVRYRGLHLVEKASRATFHARRREQKGTDARERNRILLD